MWRLLLVVALPGCDKLLSLGAITPLRDAPSEATGSWCSTQPPTPFLCADFDETPAVLFGEGIAFTVPSPPANVTAVAMPGAVSPPDALWIDASAATTGEYRIRYRDAAMAVQQLHAELDLKITSTSKNATEIVNLGVDEPTLHCYVQLQLGPQQVVNIRSDCDGVIGAAAEVVGAIPADFAHYTLDFDGAARRAWATFGGNMTMITLPTVIAANPPHAEIGVFYINNGGAQVAFDNVVVTTP